MLSGDDNGNGFKTNRSNKQKHKWHMQYPFPLIRKRTNLHVQYAFFLSLTVVLYDYNAVLYD